MNADQEHNIREAVRVIGETLFRAWSYLHVMRGLQRGARANTQRVEKHALALDVIYRALFDALFASVGTVLDRTRSTYSLPNLINMITRYGIADAELRRELGRIEVELADSANAPMRKLERWRHKVVAHKTQDGQAAEFHPENKLHLDEVEGVLTQLENLANRVTVPLLREGYDWRNGSELRCTSESEGLFA